MSVRLLVKERSVAGGADKASELVLEDEAIVLGRDAKCQVVLAEQAVSRNHARISRDGSLYFLEDLGSAFGTRINGQALPKGEKRLLRNGDVIAIAQFDVTFDRVTEARGKGGESSEQVARKVVKDVMRGLAGGRENPYLRVMNGPKEGQRIELPDASELVVGRDDSADLVFEDDLMSRRHAKVRRDWSGTHVEDLDSRNGIKVNKKRVARKTLKDRDELEIGAARLLFLDPAEVREAPVVLPDEDEGEATSREKDPDPEPAKPAEAAAGPAAEPEAEAEPPPGSSLVAGDSLAESADSEEPAADEPASEEPGPEPTETPADAEAAGEDGASTGAPIEPFSFGALLGDKRTLIPLVAMAVFAVLALALLVAVLAGA